MNKVDLHFTEIAIQQAEIGFSKANFPVGAVLTINDQLIDVAHNKNHEYQTWCNHAENNLLVKNSALIKSSAKRNDAIAMYVTLEPCLYCFGGILQHRFSKLVFCVSDPIAGSCAVHPKLNQWYLSKKLEICKGILCEKYLELLFKYNEQHKKFMWHSFIEANRQYFGENYSCR